ncbi:MAG: PilZ domain-containing protein [Candidatus Methylomirabilales bacterium]
MSPGRAAGSRPPNQGAGERRRHLRFVYDAPVVICRPLGPASTGRLHNVSEGGLMVELPERFPLGTALDLQVMLGDRTVLAEAQVIWSQPVPEGSDSPHRHGLEFTRLAPQDELSLKLFLAQTFGG